MCKNGIIYRFLHNYTLMTINILKHKKFTRNSLNGYVATAGSVNEMKLNTQSY